VNRTLQDRLVKELRLTGISDIETGNEFLSGFVERFNERFAIRAAKPDDLHRPLNVTPGRLNDILCYREQRYVGAQLTFHYDRKQIILERNGISESLAGKYVELYDYADRPLEVRWNGVPLPYRVFSKDQRVNHTAIVENKRLGHALALVKAQQDLRHAPTVMTSSEKNGYGVERQSDRNALSGSSGRGGNLARHQVAPNWRIVRKDLDSHAVETSTVFLSDPTLDDARLTEVSANFRESDAPGGRFCLAPFKLRNRIGRRQNCVREVVEVDESRLITIAPDRVRWCGCSIFHYRDFESLLQKFADVRVNAHVR
jgi:hypothetical protein